MGPRFTLESDHRMDVPETDSLPEAASSRESPPRRGWRLPWIVGLGLLAVGAAWYARQTLRPRAEPMGAAHALVGQPWQPQLFSPLTGVTTPLEPARLRGKVVLMNYWGTWCYPCRRELPELVRLVRELRPHEDFLFVSVACEDTVPIHELAEKTQRFLETEQYQDIVTYADPSMRNRASFVQLAGLGETFYYPTTLILDRDHTLRGVWMGLDEGDPGPVIAAQKTVLLELLGESP